MSQTTKIPWTQHTLNPYPGCTPVSLGCQRCYAEKMAKRLAYMGQAHYQRVMGPAGGDDYGRWNGQISDRSAEAKAQLDKIKGPALVFVQSMGDLFYPALTAAQIDWVYQVAWERRDLTFQLLTKRPGRALAYYERRPAAANRPNIWFGVTAENQEWAERRIPLLLQIPAALRFVSLEPLLGPVTLERMEIPNSDIPSCHPVAENAVCHPLRVQAGTYSFGTIGPVRWLIIGCESGPRRRACQLEWVADLLEQAHAAGVLVFVKQIDIGGKVVKDPARIAAALGRRVDEIQQWPESEGRRF